MSRSSAPGLPVVLDPASLRRLSWAFGVTQIVSWGSLFYAIGVLGKSIRAELGISEPMLFAAVSGALLINGLSAPVVGRHIDRHGGRRLMAVGSLVAALAFAIIGLANGQLMYFAGWLVAGIAMPMVFYDPAFATVTRHSGGSYRQALTMITLFGGLAGTLFWPLTSVLHDALGWRGTCGVFALMHLLVCMPIHWRMIPADVPRSSSTGGVADATAASPAGPAAAAGSATPSPRGWAAASPQAKRAFVWLTIAYSFNAFNMAALLVHLLFLLQARGLTLEQAVLIGAVIGPCQVVARLSDVVMGGRIKPLTLGMIATSLVAAGVLVIALSGASMIAGLAFAVLFGMGNGLQTIARGLVVGEIFGSSAYGEWLGRMSRYVFVVHAIAPFALSALIGAGLGYENAAWVLVAVTLSALVAYRVAIPRRTTEATR
ncbi:MAG: MFS transporter [Burkholderiaceae bacterium]|nr:MFS transporter [Burkholderiaceae bacterium]MEB2318159.1 MFS transporter [Pseudomonadota bacterium]